MNPYFSTENLTVGYDGETLIRDISLSIGQGEILTLIGPNGSGKTTILKSITKHIRKLGGTVWIDDQDTATLSSKETSKTISVVLTDRVRPELMSCYDVVATGRYPYTNAFGKLTNEDRAAIEGALHKVHAWELAHRPFDALSDGQRQRVMLARAICQDAKVIVLDEPTSFLDIRHKIELLEILKEMARVDKTTVVMSLHEIDLAGKISDHVLGVKGDTIACFGPPEAILTSQNISDLYDIARGSFNVLFGNVELALITGAPRVFVVAGGGGGIPFYRGLQRLGIPFSTGILQQGDVDLELAGAITPHLHTVPAFSPIPEAVYLEALEAIHGIGLVLDASPPKGALNAPNFALLEAARQKGIPVVDSLAAVPEALAGSSSALVTTTT